MKKTISTAILTIFALTSCAAQNQTKTSAKELPKEPKSEIIATQLLESLLKDPKIANMTWQEMKESFPKGCKKRHDIYDLECPPIEGITRIAASASGNGLIEITFTPPVACKDIRSIVSKRFGEAEYNSPNGCSGNWNISKQLKRGYLRISQGKRETSNTTLQFGVEQGP